MDENNSTVAPRKFYLFGLVILLLLNVFLLFVQSRIREESTAYLIGALLANAALVLIVMAIARVWKKCRNRATMFKVAFFASLYLAFSNLITISTATTQMVKEYIAAPDPRQYQIDHDQLVKFAADLQQAVQLGRTNTLSFLLDREHFTSLIMRASSNPSLFVLKFARGASIPFASDIIFSKLALAVKSGAQLSLVKIYHKGQPIVQYRLSFNSGELLYVDFYLFIDKNQIKIEDLQIYNLGIRTSILLAELADLIKSNPEEQIPLTKNQVDSIMHLKDSEEVNHFLSRFSPLLQRSRLFARIAIEMYRNASDSASTRQAILKFSALYPDDPCLPFIHYRACADKNDLGGMIPKIDDMYRLVGSDTSLLLLKVNLLAALGKYEEAVQQLDFAAKAFHMPMTKIIETLDMDFLRSQHFKKWQSQRRMVK